MNGLDRFIRFVVVILIGGLYYFEIIPGILGYILLGLAFAFLIASITGFCPFYKSVNLSTRDSSDPRL